MRRFFLRFAAPLVLGATLLPLVKMSFDLVSGRMAEPVAQTLNRLGFWSLTLLLVTLACTPLKSLAGWTWPIKVRRQLGLTAFAYATLHFLTYAVVDQELDVADLWADVIKRKFITVGFLAFTLLVPLAVTSNRWSVRKLTFRRWKQLHRATYLAAAAGVVHFAWRVKADLREPAIFGVLLALLLGARLVAARRR